MEDAFALFLAVAGAHALGVASPGPDLALVVRQSLARGRSAGFATALGIGTGVLAHVTTGLFALPMVLEWFPDLLTMVRVVGAAFLIFIGAGMLRSAQTTDIERDAMEAHQIRPEFSAYSLGFLTNLTNAKALLFFVAVCTSLLGAEVPTWQRVGLGLWMAVATVAWFAFVALTIGNPRIRDHMARHVRRIDHATGVLLIGLGCWMLVDLQI